MKIIVKKWGNSASVRIPASVMAATNLSIDEKVDIREEKGRIIIEPIREDKLASLVANITTDNLHDEVSFGSALGEEAF
ncbi:Antitoxin MazE [Commensalibacter sp. Nvir]|nr:Antitoxin MazE [Commensalibacter sp. Nvir]